VITALLDRGLIDIDGALDANKVSEALQAFVLQSFFCHAVTIADRKIERKWRQRLRKRVDEVPLQRKY
jgi:hypothetical protein